MAETFRTWLSRQSKAFPDSLDGFIPAIEEIAQHLRMKSRVPSEAEFLGAASELGIPAEESWECFANGVIAYRVSQMKPLLRTAFSGKQETTLLFEATRPIPAHLATDYSAVSNGSAARGQGNSDYDSDWVFFESVAAAYAFARALRMSDDVNRVAIRDAQGIAWNWPEAEPRRGDGWGDGVRERHATVLLPGFTSRGGEDDVRMLRAFIEGIDPASSHFQFHQNPQLTVMRMSQAS